MANIFYLADSYRSHRRAALAYQRCLRPHRFVRTAAQADVAIVHVDPNKYAWAFVDYPELERIPCIAYAVWETSIPPASLAVTWAREVWTASRYCADILRTCNANVRVVPHVVDVHPPQRDAAVARLARASDEHFLFLYVTKVTDKRKNTAALLRAFARVHARHPHVRLVLKVNELDPRPEQRGVNYVHHVLNDAQIAALYAACDAYVSPHRSEGWGLTISDAIAYGLPVVATGYSGNLDFMDADETYLVPSREVSAGEGRGVWGEIDEDALVSRMCEVYEQQLAARQKAGLAQQRIRAFSFENVAPVVQAALAVVGIH